MKLVVIPVLILLATQIEAQVSTVFYYDEEWKLTTKESSSYYRECTYDTINQYLNGKVQDFTIKGKLFMVGFYKDKVKEGRFTFFWPNGKVKETGTFEKNVRIGIWKAFYLDGTPRHEIEFLPTSSRIIFHNDSTGKSILENGNGLWNEEWIKDGRHCFIEGNYSNGEKTGKWTCKFDNGELYYEEYYKKDKFIKGFVTNNRLKINFPIENNMQIPYSVEAIESFTENIDLPVYYYKVFKPKLSLVSHQFEDSIKKSLQDQEYIPVEEMAYPEGGMKEFYQRVASVMRYPLQAKRMGIEGRVFIQFTVNSDGMLSEFKVIRGIGGGCDEEAVRAVKMAGNWIPGKQRGKPVRSRFNIALIFKSR